MISVPLAASAHQLDEYVQATLVEIDPDQIRLDINLTPGIAIAEQVLAKLDPDHNGTISTNESEVYLESLKRDLTVRLDGRALALGLSASNVPGVEELRSGWGFINAQYRAKWPSLRTGAHTLRLENHHATNISVYLLNAAHPRSTSVQITKQNRNRNQSTGEIEFTFYPSQPPSYVPALIIPGVVLVIALFSALYIPKYRKPTQACCSDLPVNE